MWHTFAKGKKMKKIFWCFALLFILCKIYASNIAVVTLAIGDGYKDQVKFEVENKSTYYQQHNNNLYYANLEVNN